MNRSPFGARTLLASIAIIACFLTLTPTAFASSESDAAREQAKEILSDKKYGSEDKQPLAQDVDRLGRWLGGKKEHPQVKEREKQEEQVEEQYGAPKTQISPPGLGGLGVFAQILLYGFLAVIIGGIGFLIYKAISNRDKTKKEIDDITELDIDWADEEKVLEYVTDADLLEKMSEQAEQAGQFDLALRYRFRSGLLRLNDMDAITFHPSVTNAQWQLLINKETFNTLTRDFNDVTYGQRTCDVSHLSRARSEWFKLVEDEKNSSRESSAP